MKRKNLLLGIIITFLLVAAACSIGLQSVRNLLEWSPTETAVQTAEWLLEALKTKTKMPTLDELPADIRFSIGSNSMEQCWNILQKAMVRNDNQFTLRVAGVYGKYGTPIPNPVGSTQISIEVTFPDGIPVQMEYYNSTLEDCHEVVKK